MNLFVALPNHAGERLSSPFPLTLHPYSSPRSPSQDSFEDNGNRSLKLVGLLMAFSIGNPVIVKNLRLSLEVLRKDGICSNLSSIKIPGGSLSSRELLRTVIRPGRPESHPPAILAKYDQRRDSGHIPQP